MLQGEKCCRKKCKGESRVGRVTMLNKMDRSGITKKVKSEQRFEAGEGALLEDV